MTLKLTFNDDAEFLAEAARAPAGTVFRLTCRRQYGQPFIRVSVVCTALVSVPMHIAGIVGEAPWSWEPALLRLDAPCGEAMIGDPKPEAGDKAKELLDKLTKALAGAGFEVRSGMLDC